MGPSMSKWPIRLRRSRMQPDPRASPEGDHQCLTTLTPPSSPPSPALAALDRLVGSWTVTGEAQKNCPLRMDARSVLPVATRRADSVRTADHRTRGDRAPRPFGEPPSDEIHSRFYDSAGNTLDSV
jgi:hypothetical protein